MKILDLARFDKMSVPKQSLILAALTIPLFTVFAVVGDIPRGALAWTFSGALLIALNAHRENISSKKLVLPAAILLILHVPLLVWDPLRHARVLGGILKPLVMLDGCLDYAFFWLIVKILKRRDANHSEVPLSRGYTK